MIQPKQEHFHAAKIGELMISLTISQQQVKEDQYTSLLLVQRQLQLLHQEQNILQIFKRIIALTDCIRFLAFTVKYVLGNYNQDNYIARNLFN